MGSFWSDGSVSTCGGDAAFQMDGESVIQWYVPAPRSSSHCELIVLCLVAQFSVWPPLMLTDSFCALQLIRSW